jgi:hypothetical protein
LLPLAAENKRPYKRIHQILAAAVFLSCCLVAFEPCNWQALAPLPGELVSNTKKREDGIEHVFSFGSSNVSDITSGFPFRVYVLSLLLKVYFTHIMQFM